MTRVPKLKVYFPFPVPLHQINQKLRTHNLCILHGTDHNLGKYFIVTYSISINVDHY